MPFQSQRAKIKLNPDIRVSLERISRSRTESAHRIERAKILLLYADGFTVSAIARSLRTNRPKVERSIDKALQLGALAALEDVPRSGRPAVISPEAKTWVISLACQKPKELGYTEELWTTRLLADHVRRHCRMAGHPSLSGLVRGTVSKILSSHDVRPHKITYYLERRDPEFDHKMAQVLCVYRQVSLLREKGADEKDPLTAFISYDEKPGIQAIATTAPDLAPIPGKHATVGRDHEYIRHGTMTLLAGLDLLTGHVHSQVVDRHRSREFIGFLKQLDDYYPKASKIRIVLDNHSAHISQETRSYLATVPNRFEFVFTPKHGSWLNLVESFFGKLARTLLRGIRVASKDELRERILRHIGNLNEEPIVFRWNYKMTDASLV